MEIVTQIKEKLAATVGMIAPARIMKNANGENAKLTVEMQDVTVVKTAGNAEATVHAQAVKNVIIREFVKLIVATGNVTQMKIVKHAMTAAVMLMKTVNQAHQELTQEDA